MTNLKIRTWEAIVFLLMVCESVSATTSNRQLNLVDLVGQSELILVGTVKSVSDGIDDRGIPFTQVTLRVAEALRGDARGEYTFRQFGLLKPRRAPNGMTNLTVTPAGWATYSPGEQAILFLYKRAAWTGLQTTVGLGQGKFKLQMAGAMNQTNNAGLFQKMTIDSSLLGSREERAMLTQKGAVNAKAFVSLVRQAVQGKWIESGRMRHAQ